MVDVEDEDVRYYYSVYVSHYDIIRLKQAANSTRLGLRTHHVEFFPTLTWARVGHSARCPRTERFYLSFSAGQALRTLKVDCLRRR